jgi:hypothetical protein
MTRTSFGFGTPIQPEFLNAVAYPKITGLPEDGHLDLLTNDNFLNQPGTIVYDFYQKIDRLKASRFSVSGLNITVQGCTILGPLGDLLSVPTTTVAVPDNAVSWVWVNNSGAIQVTNYNPPAGVRSAKVTTGSGNITQISDLRYDYLWIPNPATLAVFGGNNLTDFTAPLGVTVLAGVLNCRNFIVPTGAVIEVDRTLTVRASGITDIAGTIRTRTNPVAWEAQGAPLMAVDQGIQFASFGTNTISHVGVPATTRNKVAPYAGRTDLSIGASTASIGRATSCTFNVSPSAITLNSGTAGAVLTINSAGPVSVAGTAVINCSATTSSTPVISPSVFSVSAYGTAPTENWNTIISLIPPSPTAGTFVLQSSTSIVIAAGATITANAANSVQGVSFSQQVVASGSITSTSGNFFAVGGGGGGAIHFQAPSVSSSPSATITANAGTTTGTTFINGPGSGGNGYNAATATAATAGPITTVLAAPIEF